MKTRQLQWFEYPIILTHQQFWMAWYHRKCSTKKLSSTLIPMVMAQISLKLVLVLRNHLFQLLMMLGPILLLMIPPFVSPNFITMVAFSGIHQVQTTICRPSSERRSNLFLHQLDSGIPNVKWLSPTRKAGIILDLLVVQPLWPTVLIYPRWLLHGIKLIRWTSPPSKVILLKQ